MARLRCLAAIRWLVLCMLLSYCLCTSTGCLTFIYAEADYFNEQKQIRETHADVTVGGRVVYESGGTVLKPVNRGGIVMMTGLHDSVRFQMHGEGEGHSTKLLSTADWFGDRFSVHLDDVREVILVFTCPGYMTCTLQVNVPPGKNAAPPPPLVIKDEVIVMHRSPTTTTSERAEPYGIGASKSVK